MGWQPPLRDRSKAPPRRTAARSVRVPVRPLFVLAVACLLLAAPMTAGVRQTTQDDIGRLLQRLEQVVLAGNPAAYLDLIQAQGDQLEAARSFALANIAPGATRVVVRERDRAELAGTAADNACRLAVDIFVEYGARARLATWRLDVVRREDGAGWAIRAQRPMSSFTSLFRLTLAARQYTVRDLVVSGEDLELRLPSGSAFVAEIDGGTTALVLLGRGRMVFAPSPSTEREQMKLFGGAERMDTAFSAAFVRLSPAVVFRTVKAETLQERPLDPGDFRTAQQVFRQDNVKSFAVNLGDLATDNWSLLPDVADFVAEVHTRRYGILTYARSAREAEDINFFDRAQRRNISLYTSRQKLADRGRFYDEDELEQYEVLHYDLDVALDPIRQSLGGTARLQLRARTNAVSAITLRLAESLQVQSVSSPEFGRLVTFRVRDHTSCVVNLPDPLAKDAVITLSVAYAGRVAPQFIDREAMTFDRAPGQDPPDQEVAPLLEPSYLYSNRSYWYPQAANNSFAPAVMRVRVAAAYTVLGSGDPDPAAASPEAGGRREFVFRVIQPVRYLSLLVGRLVPVGPPAAAVRIGGEVIERERPGAYYRAIALRTYSSARWRTRAQPIADRAVDILDFYSGLIGDCPYPTLTLAVVERELPGGHSPGFLAVLAQPAPTAPFTWRNDPASFNDYPEFFLAHELAHQWWGQAVGWKNYHEQWLSEGFAQYFAALYAERLHGQEVFRGILERLHTWAVRKSGEGPVYLGYRIGHVKRDSQLYRAIVYNKSAAVLHMMRRLLGDEAFFRGVRLFYQQYRFRKAGSDDFRKSMEAATGTKLGRFFERWIYESRLPSIRFSSRTERDSGTGRDTVVLRFDQVGQLFDVPITVTLNYEDRAPVEVLVKVAEATTEVRVPLEGRLKRVEVNRDHGALVMVET